MPTNFSPKDPANLYADYSVEQMYAFLSGVQLTRDIGSADQYSNLGGGLLGHALTLSARATDYEALVRARVITPLGLTSTAIALTPEMKARLAVGHGATMQPVANWDLAALAGAGALRSTTNDLLTFLAANLGYVKTPLAPAMATMLTVRRPTGGPNLAVALGWHVLTMHGKDLIWHNGGTGGYRTFIGFDPLARVGIVVTVERRHGCRPGRHRPSPAGGRISAARAASAGENTNRGRGRSRECSIRYVGRYQLAPTAILSVTREDSHFFAQLTGQPRFEIFAEGPEDYFLKVVDAQLTFEVDGSGRAATAVLHQAGRDIRAVRIE